jgi:hypothetical protein
MAQRLPNRQDINQALKELDTIEGLQVLLSMAIEQIDKDVPIDSDLHRISVLIEAYQPLLMCSLVEIRAYLKHYHT